MPEMAACTPPFRLSMKKILRIHRVLQEALMSTSADARIASIQVVARLFGRLGRIWVKQVAEKALLRVRLSAGPVGFDSPVTFGQ